MRILWQLPDGNSWKFEKKKGFFEEKVAFLSKKLLFWRKGKNPLKTEEKEKKKKNIARLKKVVSWYYYYRFLPYYYYYSFKKRFWKKSKLWCHYQPILCGVILNLTRKNKLKILWSILNSICTISFFCRLKWLHLEEFKEWSFFFYISFKFMHIAKFLIKFLGVLVNEMCY